MDLGQVGRWERGTHQPRSGGESRRAVTWSDLSFPNPRTVSTVVESLLIILCLYCIYKCIRRPHNTGTKPMAPLSVQMRALFVNWCIYHSPFSPKYSCSRHPIAHPWGWGMGCPLWVQNLLYHPSLSTVYNLDHVMLDLQFDVTGDVVMAIMTASHLLRC